MITQGTDYQSRGVWTRNQNRGEVTPTMSIFRPARYTCGLLDWAVSRICTTVPLPEWNVETDILGWKASYLFAAIYSVACEPDGRSAGHYPRFGGMGGVPSR
jgi:hypothetical protein